jgi:ABC-2 type transport system ATP-binding protein
LFEEVLILSEGSLVLKEEAEVLRDNTCAVSGKKGEVEKFIQDKDVLDRKQFAGMMTAYIFGDGEEARASGLSVEGVPIQELMIALTSRKEGA